MFGDAAEALLKLMGQSGNIPGAIMGADVADAMANLKRELADQPAQESAASDSTADDDESNRVALATRAVPLMELLEAAAASKANVMWDK